MKWEAEESSEVWVTRVSIELVQLGYEMMEEVAEEMKTDEMIDSSSKRDE